MATWTVAQYQAKVEGGSACLITNLATTELIIRLEVGTIRDITLTAAGGTSPTIDLGTVMDSPTALKQWDILAGLNADTPTLTAEAGTVKLAHAPGVDLAKNGSIPYVDTQAVPKTLSGKCRTITITEVVGEVRINWDGTATAASATDEKAREGAVLPCFGLDTLKAFFVDETADDVVRYRENGVAG